MLVQEVETISFPLFRVYRNNELQSAQDIFTVFKCFRSGFFLDISANVFINSNCVICHRQLP